jgi:hypothetical protein
MPDVVAEDDMRGRAAHARACGCEGVDGGTAEAGRRRRLVFKSRPRGEGMGAPVVWGVEKLRWDRRAWRFAYGEGVVAERGLKLCPTVVSLILVDEFHRGLSGLHSVDTLFLDTLRDGVGGGYSRAETPETLALRFEVLDLERGVLRGILV